MSLKGEILAAFAARLGTVTAANGYGTNVKLVVYDDVPMGLDLQDHELPAVLILDRDDVPVMEHHKLKGEWQLKCQLWSARVTDSVMLDFVRDVFKAIFANHPTTQTNGAFRAIHSRIVEIVPASIAGDLNMIESNRVYEVSFLVRYRTELFDL